MTRGQPAVFPADLFTIVIHCLPIERTSMPLFQIVAVIYGFMTLVSCASTPRPDVIVHDGPEGGVYLERVTDKNVQAAHPIKLDSRLIARILNGVQVGEPKTAAQTLFASNVKPERVFSDEDAAFLAPLISSGLAQATAEQQVRFRVVHLVSPIDLPAGGGAGIGSFPTPTGGLQKETTEGTLYAHGRSLHVTLDEYRHRQTKPDIISGPNRYYPDPNGLKEREVRFVPQSALRPENYKQSDGNTIVIDYEALAKAPRPDPAASLTATPATAASASVSNAKTSLTQTEDAPRIPPFTASGPTESSKTTTGESDEVGALKDLVIKKDMELENLKKELKSLRRQLSERDSQLDSMRKKPKPTPKSPDIVP
jgi:hypothetical protein